MQRAIAPKIRRRLWIALLLLCAIGAAAAGIRIMLLVLPAPAPSSQAGDLNAHFSTEESIVLAHIAPALLFVLLLPLQFVSRLRNRHPKFHRWNGRIVMVLGIVIGISALRLSLHPTGGIVESAATISFGCFFLFSLAKAWLHIRHRRVALHREWVLRMAAIALGVATARPIMGVFFATQRLTGLTPHQFFGPAIWLGFVSTYLAMEGWIRYTRSRARSARFQLVGSRGGNVTI